VAEEEDPHSVHPTVREAHQVIKDFHDRGIEPTAAEVAAASVQAVKCHRDGVQGRRYTFKLKEKIAEMFPK